MKLIKILALQFILIGLSSQALYDGSSSECELENPEHFCWCKTYQQNSACNYYQLKKSQTDFEVLRCQKPDPGYLCIAVYQEPRCLEYYAITSEEKAQCNPEHRIQIVTPEVTPQPSVDEGPGYTDPQDRFTEDQLYSDGDEPVQCNIFDKLFGDGCSQEFYDYMESEWYLAWLAMVIIWHYNIHLIGLFGIPATILSWGFALMMFLDPTLKPGPEQEDEEILDSALRDLMNLTAHMVQPEYLVFCTFWTLFECPYSKTELSNLTAEEATYYFLFEALWIPFILPSYLSVNFLFASFYILEDAYLIFALIEWYNAEVERQEQEAA